MSKYTHLNADERNELHRGLNAGMSLRAIGRAMQRSSATLSRELRRNGMSRRDYDAPTASGAAIKRRRRGPVKMKTGYALQKYVFSCIRKGWSPQQIAETMKEAPDVDLPRVSHETIYRAIYVLPRGEIRKELISLLRQGKKKRGTRKSGSGSGVLKDTVSIHERDASVLTRDFVGHWEGDFVKGAGNKSAIGTLVERKSRYTLIAKMDDCSAQSALASFSQAFSRLPQAMRQTFTYDCGTEMAKHKELEAQTGVKVYFCDPHSPWQRPTNENTNGLIRQYLPKGTDLSGYSQEDLDKISESLNTRPRAILGYKTPRAVFEAEIVASQCAALQC